MSNPPAAGGRGPLRPAGNPGALPDGWHLEVVGSNETQLPVAPLTTAISSREYLIAGTFTGKITGGGKTKLTGGSMEAGEQIGCGIISDETEINPGASFTPGIGIPFTGNAHRRVRRQPAGQGVPEARHGDHRRDRQEEVQGHRRRASPSPASAIKTDQCAGQSFIRSYATLTSSTDNTDDVITYLGVTKAV